MDIKRDDTGNPHFHKHGTSNTMKARTPPGKPVSAPPEPLQMFREHIHTI